MFTFPTLSSFNTRVISKMNIASQVSCYKGEQAEDLKGLHVRVVAGLLNKITLVREEGILNTFQHIHCVHVEIRPISYHTEVALPSLRSIRPPSMTSLSWL
jgi:hypothetical protein